MNLTKDQFRKMKQLDKIEYMLRHDKINDSMRGLSIISEINLFIEIYLLIFIIILVFWVKFPDSTKTIYLAFGILNLYPKVFCIIIVISIIYNTINYVYRTKKLNELKKEFSKKNKKIN